VCGRGCGPPTRSRGLTAFSAARCGHITRNKWLAWDRHSRSRCWVHSRLRSTLRHFIETIAIDEVLGKSANQVIPLGVVLRRSDDLLVPEGMHILAQCQFLGMKLISTKGARRSSASRRRSDRHKQSCIPDGLARLRHRRHFVMQDVVEANVTKLSDFLYLAEIAAVTLAQGKNGASRPNVCSRSAERAPAHGIDNHSFGRVCAEPEAAKNASPSRTLRRNEKSHRVL